MTSKNNFYIYSVIAVLLSFPLLVSFFLKITTDYLLPCSSFTDGELIQVIATLVSTLLASILIPWGINRRGKITEMKVAYITEFEQKFISYVESGIQFIRTQDLNTAPKIFLSEQRQLTYVLNKMRFLISECDLDNFDVDKYFEDILEIKKIVSGYDSKKPQNKNILLSKLATVRIKVEKQIIDSKLSNFS